MALNGYDYVALVKFVEGHNTDKVYSFALYDHGICAGSYALVRTDINYYNTQYGIVEIVDVKSVSEYKGTTPTAEIVCLVDPSAYYERCEMRKKRNALKKEMNKIAKRCQEMSLLEAVAKDCPEMAELLEEYKKLLNV